MDEPTTEVDTRNGRVVPSRSDHRPVRRACSGADANGAAASSGPGPILDGTKSAPRVLSLDLPPSYPTPDADPCATGGHDHSDRPDGIDLPCALAGFFVRRAEPFDSLYLWTGTHDPKRLGAGRGPLAVRDRVGHAAALRAAEQWWDTLRAEDDGVSVLYGMEAHKSGARHAHALVATSAEFRYRGPSALWFERNGWNQFDPVRSAEAAGRYAGKYATKELGVIRLGLHGGVFK